ncbi:MAG: AbrB/MazE/SpoVT family DNA-binding domain-containing protein [Bradymonadales bacterium]|nr:AbrB/MazE/SpoVT family DNA-binding domain-containing protein [Bradymonadales bacterium]
MKAKIQKWGNSLALRIPKPFAQEVGLEENSLVQVSLQGDSLLIRPVNTSPSLSELLDLVTEENMHKEIDMGRTEGREEW